MPKLTHSYEGSGGRAGGHQAWESAALLAGTLSDDKPAPVMRKVCANPRCRKLFSPRADGDNYCCCACDTDNNPCKRMRR